VYIEDIESVLGWSKLPILKKVVGKPTTIEEYKIWAKTKFRIMDDSVGKNYYENVTKKMQQTFENSNYWKMFNEKLLEEEEKYYRKNHYNLLQSRFVAQIYIKPYDSFVDKCFRKNILLNDNWPDPPKGDWINYQNAYSHFGDIIRTNVVVQYLDAIECIKNLLIHCCEKENYEYKLDYQAKSEGYYAVHFDVSVPFEIPSLTWETDKIDGHVEIQITTELKELIKNLIHQAYVDHRSEKHSTEKFGWQWDYTSDEFMINYLGHIMHYLEGNILDIRDRRLKKHE
jgi:hypothetical protein